MELKEALELVIYFAKEKQEELGIKSLGTAIEVVKEHMDLIEDVDMNELEKLEPQESTTAGAILQSLNSIPETSTDPPSGEALEDDEELDLTGRPIQKRVWK